MCYTRHRHIRCIQWGTNRWSLICVCVCVCSQPLPWCAKEILERLHVVLSENQRPELARPAQKKQGQHHEAGSWRPDTVSHNVHNIVSGTLIVYQSNRVVDCWSPACPLHSLIQSGVQTLLLLFLLHIMCLFLRSAPSSPDVSPQSSPRPPRANNDRLTLLTRLVRKGEKKGLFVEKMPASIYQVK